jgi:hypothetical protein
MSVRRPLICKIASLDTAHHRRQERMTDASGCWADAGRLPGDRSICGNTSSDMRLS